MSESPLSEYDVPWWLRTRPNRSVASNQPSRLLSLLIKPLQQDFAYLRSIGGDPLATSPATNVSVMKVDILSSICDENLGEAVILRMLLSSHVCGRTKVLVII